MEANERRKESGTRVDEAVNEVTAFAMNACRKGPTITESRFAGHAGLS